MRIKPSLLLDPNAAPASQGAFSVPQTPADPGTTVVTYSPQGATVVQEGANPLSSAPEAIPGNPPSPAPADQQAALPDPNAPPVPEQQAPADPFPLTTPDGKFVNIYKENPRTGRREFYTRISNTPEAMAAWAESQSMYVDQLRRQPEPPPSQPAALPPDPKSQTRERISNRAKEIAEARFKSVDPEANVGPLAEAMADLASEIFDTLEGKQAEQARESQILSELERIQKVDPRFNPREPFVQDVYQWMKKTTGIDPTPSMVYGQILAFEQMAKAEAQTNGHQAQNTAPPPAPPITPGSPMSAFSAPTGSQPTGTQDPMNTHPEVIASLNAYRSSERGAGRTPTPEAEARIVEFAKQGIKNRGTHGFVLPSNQVR